MAGVFYFPLIGTPTAEGNLLSFFQAGTDVPLSVWTDSDLTIAWAQPITLNAAGESDGPIYVSSSPSYKVVYTDSTGAAIAGYPVDMVSPSTIPGVMTTATVTLTDAQIKALPTTGITLVAAPASGLRVKVFSASFLATLAGAYTNINSTSCQLIIANGTGGTAVWLTVGLVNKSTTSPALTRVSGLLGSATTQLVDLAAYTEVPATTTQGFVIPQAASLLTGSNGVAVTLSVDNNGSGNFTGGNASNTLRVTVYYALESVS